MACRPRSTFAALSCAARCCTSAIRISAFYLSRFRISVTIWRHPGGRNGEEAECETEEEGGQAQSRPRFP
jgi:hypothetical protein